MFWYKTVFLGLHAFSNVNVQHKGLQLQDWGFRLGICIKYFLDKNSQKQPMWPALKNRRWAFSTRLSQKPISSKGNRDKLWVYFGHPNFLSTAGKIKFIYSEKTTKFCEISNVDLTVTAYDKSRVEISQKIVAFSEYMNFNAKNPKTFSMYIDRTFIQKIRHFLYISWVILVLWC